MKPLYLFANWKMYLDHDQSVALAKSLASELPKHASRATFAVFPSDLALTSVQSIMAKAKIAVGAQNVYWIEEGGYTGATSVEMYRKVGCEYALVGHSERRHIFKETNVEVRKKMEAILADGMTSVLCVGETAHERKENEADVVIETQLRAAYTDLLWPKGRELIIAYEPVWAIGTGQSCDPDEAERVAMLIDRDVRALLGDVKPIILYGGSVRADDVRGYLSEKYLQGVLVGGASTKTETWLEIVENS